MQMRCVGETREGRQSCLWGHAQRLLRGYSLSLYTMQPATPPPPTVARPPSQVVAPIAASRPPALAQPSQTAQPVLRPPPAQTAEQQRAASAEQRAAAKLSALPPQVPREPHGATEPLTRFERVRWQLQLRSQNELADSSAWAREILSPASAAAAEAPAATARAMRDELKRRQTQGEEAIASMSAAHAIEICALRDGSARFREDIASLKRAAMSGDAERVAAVKRARQAAHPSVQMVEVKSAMAAAPDIESTSAPKPPASGIVQI